MPSLTTRDFCFLDGNAALSICTLLACAAANAATLNVHNDTDEPLILVYISPTSSGIFSDRDEQLGDHYGADLCTFGDWYISE